MTIMRDFFPSPKVQPDWATFNGSRENSPYIVGSINVRMASYLTGLNLIRQVQHKKVKAKMGHSDTSPKLALSGLGDNI